MFGNGWTMKTLDNTLLLLRQKVRKFGHLADISNDALDSDDIGKCHDWRNHVDPDIKNIWKCLSEESRLCVVIIANNIAEREELD